MADKLIQRLDTGLPGIKTSPVALLRAKTLKNNKLIAFVKKQLSTDNADPVVILLDILNNMPVSSPNRKALIDLIELVVKSQAETIQVILTNWSKAIKFAQKLREEEEKRQRLHPVHHHHKVKHLQQTAGGLAVVAQDVDVLLSVPPQVVVTDTIVKPAPDMPRFRYSIADDVREKHLRDYAAPY